MLTLNFLKMRPVSYADGFDQTTPIEVRDCGSVRSDFVTAITRLSVVNRVELTGAKMNSNNEFGTFLIFFIDEFCGRQVGYFGDCAGF